LLAKAYTKLKQSTLGTKFELLFVSADESQDEFDGYFKDMNFGAIPFADEAKFALTKGLQVRGYPTLLMLSIERELINPNIRGIIENGDYISDFPYFPKPYGDLNHTPSDINDHRCIIVFHEGGDDEEQEDVVDAIKAASAQYPDLIMYWATTVSQVTQSVRGALTLGAITPNPILILLDIPDNGGYYVCENKGEITDEVICQFVEQPGKRIQIQG
jgi:nucleoredoxin